MVCIYIKLVSILFIESLAADVVSSTVTSFTDCIILSDE